MRSATIKRFLANVTCTSSNKIDPAVKPVAFGENRLWSVTVCSNGLWLSRRLFESFVTCWRFPHGIVIRRSFESSRCVRTTGWGGGWRYLYYEVRYVVCLLETTQWCKRFAMSAFQIWNRCCFDIVSEISFDGASVEGVEISRSEDVVTQAVEPEMGWWKCHVSGQYVVEPYWKL